MCDWLAFPRIDGFVADTTTDEKILDYFTKEGKKIVTCDWGFMIYALKKGKLAEGSFKTK